MRQLYLYTIAMLLFFSACQSKQKHAVDQKETATNTTELPSLAYTIYTDKTELFAEFRTLVAGDTVNLGGHFTRLGDLFTAVTDGTITMSIVVGDKTVSQESTVSSSPGIFRFALVPPATGVGKLVFEVKNKYYTDRLVIDNITVYTDKQAAIASAEEEPKSNDITYLKEQAWKVEFANQPVVSQPFCEIIKTAGEILPAAGDEMVVTANADGIVTFSGNKAVIGTSVGKGTMMFTISGGNLTSGNTETRYQQAKASYEKAKADFERAQELIKDNIVSQKDFLEIKAKYETNRAAYNNISRNYSSGGQKVTTPISGFVKSVMVTEGQFVNVGQPLATVSQNKRLVLNADVSQKYFNKLPFIASANFSTTYDDKTYEIESLNGKLVSYGKSNDAHSLFIPVTFSFDNEGEVVPGSMVDVFLKLKSKEESLVIPISSLIEEQGIFFAYVQTAGESFAKRELTLGGNDGINVQVLSGVKEGERVVTKGAYQIKLATSSGTIPAHGHAH